MRIVQVNTFDIRGGAARAAYRLNTTLGELGHNSTMYVWHKDSENERVIAFQPPTAFLARVKRRVRRIRIERDFARYKKSRPSGYELFSDARAHFGETVVQQLPPCDIVNLHWVAGFLDYESFFRCLPVHCPIVWTLHDMNALTGGCHYDLGCARYNEGCGACPQLGSKQENDLARKIWNRKKRAFTQIPDGRLHIITPSQWLAAESSRSALLHRFQVSVIPNGLNIDDFAPRNRELARDILGVPQDATAILLVADGLAHIRKGMAILVSALQQLHGHHNVCLVTIGGDRPTGELPFPVRHLGSVPHGRLLSLAYNCADLSVTPSLQDNAPMTVLESMASGTPVVGFAVGGIPEMVRPMETGLLAQVGDVTDLARQIQWLLEHPEDRLRMGQNARRVVEQEFTLEIQARRYFDLYQRLLSQ